MRLKAILAVSILSAATASGAELVSCSLETIETPPTWNGLVLRIHIADLAACRPWWKLYSAEWPHIAEAAFGSIDDVPDNWNPPAPWSVQRPQCFHSFAPVEQFVTGILWYQTADDGQFVIWVKARGNGWRSCYTSDSGRIKTIELGVDPADFELSVVMTGEPIFTDGFESGDFSAWAFMQGGNP